MQRKGVRGGAGATPGLAVALTLQSSPVSINSLILGEPCARRAGRISISSRGRSSSEKFGDPCAVEPLVCP